MEKFKKGNFTPEAFRSQGLSVLGKSRLSTEKKNAVRRLLDSLPPEERFNVGWAAELAGRRGILTAGEASRLMSEIYRSQWQKQQELQRKFFGKK